jgi:hypothetical protein
MATTPGGLPYPLPTDPIAAGADAIKNLALALDPFWKPTWVPVTLNSGWVWMGAPHNTPAYAVFGDWVFLRGAIKNNTGGAVSAATAIFTLPAACYPVNQQNFLSFISNVGGMLRCHVAANGVFTANFWASGTIGTSNQYFLIDGFMYSRS